MSKEDADRSGRGFWRFLRTKKAPLPEEEKPEEGKDSIEEKGTPEASEGESFDALFAHWDTELGTSEVEPSTAPPPESPENAKARRSEPPAWEISEEAEIRKPEASEWEPSEETEAREPEGSASGSWIVVEELRTLEEQVASLESCIAERLEQRR